MPIAAEITKSAAAARSFDPQPLIVQTEEQRYLGLRRIPVVPPIDAGTTAPADQTVKTLGDERAVLLARHGVVGTGRDPHDALAVCAAVEHHAIIEHSLRVEHVLAITRTRPERRS